ncbi:MAG: hypothetical protein CL912_21370 [Deltaproteobacteria bacterium]|nr:hypothetical protein [Deltaproteobacteria bacterium]
MKAFYITFPALLAALASAAPAEEIEKRATPTIYMAGDSTMAVGGGGSGTNGKKLLFFGVQTKDNLTFSQAGVSISHSLSRTPTSSMPPSVAAPHAPTPTKVASQHLSTKSSPATT